MAVTIVKGYAGKEDIRFHTSASPVFYRNNSQGNATAITALAATHIPLTNASQYFSVNNVERAIKETISRYFSKEHSLATYQAGAGVGDHFKVFGYKNALAATSIQAAASNQFLIEGSARIYIPRGTFTAATPIQLPRKCVIFGNGPGSIIRASSTIQTSRVFSISGSVSATSSALSANATIGKQIVSVVLGTKFRRGDWIVVRDSKNAELQQIRSISGNDLTVSAPLRHTYRSAATIANASLIYPAEIYMDNMAIQLTSGTQGIGISATYMVKSYIGDNVDISGSALAGVKLDLSEGNVLNPVVRNPSSVAGANGVGVRLTNSSGNNRLGGMRIGTTRDVADTKSESNVYSDNRILRSFYAASGIIDPLSYYVRHNKPTLHYATYAATTVVTCDANPLDGTSNTPAVVMIGGRLYSNAARVMCDLSRTIVPNNATVGGLDRGPAATAQSYHLYAVPTVHPSATRQWDLIASTGDPLFNGGPTAAATYPDWSYLGSVSTGATKRVIPFEQTGNFFRWKKRHQVVKYSSPIASDVAYTTLNLGAYSPINSYAGEYEVDLISAAISTWQEGRFSLSDPSETHLNYHILDLAIHSGRGVPTRTARGNVKGTCTHGNTPLNQVKKLFQTGGLQGTYDITLYMVGSYINRAAWK